MMRSVVGLVIAVLGSWGVAFADMPPPWSEFDIRSPNGHYLAEVRATQKPEGAPRWAWKYQLTVFDTQPARRQLLWSCDYTHDGYSNGFLSDDGYTFVYVNFWYEQDGPVVSLYRNGKKVGIVFGREFNVRDSALKSTVSHQMWLDELGSPNVRFIQRGPQALVLEITTIDHKTHLISVESGKFVKP